MELYWGPGDHLRMKPALWLLLYLGRKKPARYMTGRVLIRVGGTASAGHRTGGSPSRRGICGTRPRSLAVTTAG